MRLKPHEIRTGDSILLKYDGKLHRGIVYIDVGDIVKYHFRSFAGFNIEFTLANVELETIKLYKVGK